MAIITYDENLEKIKNMEVTIYQEPEKISDVLSKARLRIFYKGMNRNRTFISEDFALKLENSLPYTPVKGIYDDDIQDFEGHGEEKDDGRIYGIVPENPNASYEEHLDDDGITRSYLCCDVYLFTGLYDEAKQIIGKSQSMELFTPTLKFEYRLDDNGKPYIYFIDGCFLGLQILGELTEPCFEGSAFFTLQSDIKKITTYIKNYEQQEVRKMDKAIFRLSDNEKYEAIFDALNPNDEINAIILDVYDDYAITYNCKKKNYERVYYSKTEDSVNIGDIVKCYIVDVTESEYNALETMKAMNNNTYELINENFVQKSEFTILKEENDKYSIEKEQLQNSNEQLQNSNEQLQNSNKELQSNIELYEAQIQTLQAENTKITDENNTLKNDNQQLSAFKCNVESEQKEQIINKFEEILTDTALNEFKLNKDKYSAEELEKELCLTAFKSNPTIFSKEAEPLVYKNDLALKRNSEMSGCERLIDNYKRNGGNK